MHIGVTPQEMRETLDQLRSGAIAKPSVERPARPEPSKPSGPRKLVDATSWVELEGEPLARAAFRLVRFGPVSAVHERVEAYSDGAIARATCYRFRGEEASS